MYELGNAYIINGWNECPELDDEIFDRKVTKTAYGVLNKYAGDCMAWSDTFYTLCNMAGLEVVTVNVCSAEVGGVSEAFMPDHRMNAIKINNEYYFVDSFWSWQKVSPNEGTYR